MIIADNVLSHNLSNVLWISGGPCGGKSTITNLLAEKYNFTTYHTDDYIFEHRKIASIYEQPAMTRYFVDWEWFFNRPEDEYINWLTASTEEQFSMVIVDLIRLSSSEQRVIVDGNFTPFLLKQISPVKNSIFLFADSSIVKNSYFDREHTKGMLDLINSTSNPKKSLNNVQNVVSRISDETFKKVKESGLNYFLRDTSNTTDEILNFVEKSLGLI
jgi:cytidylate kinase